MSGGYPFGYHLTKLRGDDGTPFADPAEQRRVWGREWGAADEVGRLRMALVRRPRGEFGAVRADCCDADSGGAGDSDPGNGTRTGADGRWQLRQADADGGGVRDVVSLQRRGGQA